MPLVFIHGVNNRQGDEYAESEIARNAFLREIVAPAIGVPPDAWHISNPYWGQHGALFAWGMACLPDRNKAYEAFGSEALEGLRPNETIALSHEAENEWPKTIERIFAEAMRACGDEVSARALAKTYVRLISEGKPEWLSTIPDKDFEGKFMHHASEESGMNSFGAHSDSIKEALSRLGSLPNKIASDKLGDWKREDLNSSLTRFAGDAFVYFARRGTPQNPGEIVSSVVSALEEARAKTSDEDSQLVVVAHSFGGELVYDILTQFAPSISVDLLVTVGSQVALFEEMKLYLASTASIGKHSKTEKVPLPSSIKRWLNVFDKNDILSYEASAVFEGVTDYEYETGYGSLRAHGGYFTRPSFYKKLAERIGHKE